MTTRDDSRIFADNAPLFYKHKLGVVPLMPWNSTHKSRGKAPQIQGWQRYATEFPSEAVQDHWIASFPDSNLGLPLGPSSGLCVIDIDTDDENLIEAIEGCLPASPWIRVGQKGKVLVYKYTGVRNWKVRDENNNSICEGLGAGNQVVVFGVHPKTEKPYVSNCNLYDVLTKIQLCPLDIEDRIRNALAAAGLKLGGRGRSAPLDVIPSGERDTQMVRHAGYLSRIILGIEKSAVFSLQEAIDHMHHWVEEYTSKVAGDTLDPAKGVAKLLEFALRDIEKGRTLPEGWDAELRPEWLAHPTVEALLLKNQRARWTVSRAREWLSGKVGEKPDDDDWVLARTNEMISLVAADEQFGDGDIRALVGKVLPTIANLGLKKSDLLVMFKLARRGETEDEAQDQHALALRVVEELEKAGEIRHDLGKFWQYSGARWAELPSDDVYLVAASIKNSTLMKRNSDYEAVVKVCQRLVKNPLVISEERGLNFANGWLGTDLVLQDHDPKFGATFTMPFDYAGAEGAHCPRFQGFLASCWGLENDYMERVGLLQEAMAATMFGLMPGFQKAILLHGRPGTGKTVLLSIMRSLMPPEGVSDISPMRWGERFAMAGMAGRALNVCGEIPEAGYIPGAIFKVVVEGSPMELEYKNVDPFSVKLIAAHWFAGNYLPASKDSSEGFIRRWMVLGFDQVVPENERLVGLAEDIIAEERQAIAAWALGGLGRLLQAGRFTEPRSHLELVAEMRRINNSVLAWLDSNGRYVKTSNEADAAGGMELYDAYVFHVRNVNRGMATSYERFIQMLYDMGLGRLQVREVNGVMGWRVTGVRGVVV